MSNENTIDGGFTKSELKALIDKAQDPDLTHSQADDLLDGEVQGKNTPVEVLLALHTNRDNLTKEQYRKVRKQLKKLGIPQPGKYLDQMSADDRNRFENTPNFNKSSSGSGIGLNSSFMQIAAAPTSMGFKVTGDAAPHVVGGARKTAGKASSIGKTLANKLYETVKSETNVPLEQLDETVDRDGNRIITVESLSSGAAGRNAKSTQGRQAA